MQSSPPASDGKARAIRELSRSLNHSPRNVTSPSPPPSDSNPTKRSGFSTESSIWDDRDLLMSTQHKIEEDTLPRYPHIRSTAKKVNTWHMLRSEQPNPDTSMVNKAFNDFDHATSDEDTMSIEQARGLAGSVHSTPNKMSSPFNSLYDITPPTNRSRKSHAAETGSLRRDAQIRRASRKDLGANNLPVPAQSHNQGRASLAQLHAKVSEGDSSFMDQRPPTLTMDSAKNTRWGSRNRQTLLPTDGPTEASPRAHGSTRLRPNTAQNATVQSFILPDLPNLTELVSGVFDDGTPVFSKTAPARSRFSALQSNGPRQPQHVSLEGAPIPQEEKAIFAALQQLQAKVGDMEHERAEQEGKIEEQELELIELRAKLDLQEKLRRSGSAQDSESGKGSWKVEKTRLDATIQTLQTKLDRSDRKFAVLEIEKKRLNTERDNITHQLGIAFQTCEELKNEKQALDAENQALQRDMHELRVENEELRDQLQHEHSQHREETTQLKRRLDQATNATERTNATLHAELARVRAQNDENTQQLSRKDLELRKARQEQSEYSRLKSDHESLKSQLAAFRAKREEEIKRWAQQESALKAQVGRRDETIRLFQDTTQEQANEALRLDNQHLRHELAELAAQHDHESEQWVKMEAGLRRKVQQREGVARKVFATAQEASVPRKSDDMQSGAFAAKSNVKSSANVATESMLGKPAYRREDINIRVKNRVRQEIRDSKAQSSHAKKSPSKTYTGVSRFSNRAVSAPIHTDGNTQAESEAESTTDLSLTPNDLSCAPRSVSGMKPSTVVPPPAVLDMTELSIIDSKQIAALRKTLEEERAAARRRTSSTALELDDCEERFPSEQRVREDTVRSVASLHSERRPSLARKSSLKDTTQRTQFEEDGTGGVPNSEADVEPTRTKQSDIDLSMLSNTSRRRRSAARETTSAFIIPDIKLDVLEPAVGTSSISRQSANKDHDNANCTVCRREGLARAENALVVPKLIPVSSRMPDDIDATLRPARSPKEALALVVKGLQDERAHLHMELAVMRAMLESHDVSLGNRKRGNMNASMQDLLRKLEIKDTQIYHLYDVLEGQHTDELTELDVENITQHIRAEVNKAESEKKSKKVTIRSFVEDDDDSIEAGRGVVAASEDGDTQDLPWEGFEESEAESYASHGALDGWRLKMH